MVPSWTGESFIVERVALSQVTSPLPSLSHWNLSISSVTLNPLVSFRLSPLDIFDLKICGKKFIREVKAVVTSGVKIKHDLYPGKQIQAIQLSTRHLCSHYSCLSHWQGKKQWLWRVLSIFMNSIFSFSTTQWNLIVSKQETVKIIKSIFNQRIIFTILHLCPKLLFYTILEYECEAIHHPFI